MSSTTVMVRRNVTHTLRNPVAILRSHIFGSNLVGFEPDHAGFDLQIVALKPYSIP